jgi:hypothetical protein
VQWPVSGGAVMRGRAMTMVRGGVVVVVRGRVVVMMRGRVNFFRLWEVTKLREAMAVLKDTLVDTEGQPNAPQFGCSPDTGKIQHVSGAMIPIPIPRRTKRGLNFEYPKYACTSIGAVYTFHST